MPALAAGQAPAEVNRIVLRVNDRILTLYDYEVRKQELIGRISSTADLPPERRQTLLASAGEEVLRSVYEEMLLLSRSDMIGVSPTDEAVAAAIERAKQSYGIQSEAEFDEALAQSGLTREALRDQFRRNLAMQEVIAREIRPRIQLEEEDLRRYYRAHPEEFELPARYQLREVVVLDSSSLSAAERSELAADLRARLDAGEVPEEEIEDLSVRGLTTEWIDLGWIQPGDLDPQLESAVQGLEAGQVSQPIAARGGIHLVQVLDRKDAELPPFAEVESRIAERESNRLFAQELDEYMEELEVSSYILSRPPPEAANFRAGARDPEADDPLAGLDEPELSPVDGP